MKRLTFFLGILLALCVRAFPGGGHVGSFTHVRTIDELRALSPIAKGGFASVAGYYRAGDAGGGRFIWSPDSNALEDGGLVVASTISNTGRWLRDDPRALNTRMFGARADGVTDDSARLQAMLDGAARLPRVTSLIFSRGTYFLNRTQETLYPGNNRAILSLGHLPLTGRTLHLSGANATLFSNISPEGAPILLVRASFRRLTISGLTFEKTSRPLLWADAPAEGLVLTSVDRREIDSIRLLSCRFINCHRAFSAGLNGLGLRGKVRRFDVDHCQFLYPYGANAESGVLSYGGSQMTYGGPWIDQMTYRNCLFDGASLGSLDPVTCPGRQLKDGGHFGDPGRLIFVNNIVRHFSVEGVFKTSEPWLDWTHEPFTMPPADDTTPVTVRVGERDSDYPPGERVYIRNTGYVTLRGFDPVTRMLTFTNPGDSGNAAPGTELPIFQLIYDLDHHRQPSLIANNVFDGTLPAGSQAEIRIGLTGPGYPAIAVNDTRTIIRGNRIINSMQAIAIYARQIPGRDGSAGTEIIDNIIETFPSALLPEPHNASGVFSDSIGTCIADNKISTPAGRRFYGIYLLQPGGFVTGNTISATERVVNGATTQKRSVGVLVGSTARNSVIFGNTSRRLDVGAGSDGSDVPFAVGRHFSVEDGLPVDFKPSTTRLSLGDEQVRSREFLRRLRVGDWAE